MHSASDTTNQRTLADGPYLSTLLARIRASHPDFPLDTTILNSLLLSLVAPVPSTPFTVSETAGKGGGLHVILRTKKEDITLVANFANLVSGISVYSTSINIRDGVARRAFLCCSPNLESSAAVQIWSLLLQSM